MHNLLYAMLGQLEYATLLVAHAVLTHHIYLPLYTLILMSIYAILKKVLRKIYYISTSVEWLPCLLHHLCKSILKYVHLWRYIFSICN